MCGPIIVTEAKEILEDGIEIGFNQGQAKGENKLGALINSLIKAGRNDEIKKAASDTEYRQKLYEEFGIK